jgi:hypothetical protein
MGGMPPPPPLVTRSDDRNFFTISCSLRQPVAPLPLAALASGDVVTVTRIARSTFDLFAIVKQIGDAKAQLRSLAEPWADTGTGRLMAVLGGLAQRSATLSAPAPPGPQPGAEARAAHGRPKAAGRRAQRFVELARSQRRGKEHDFTSRSLDFVSARAKQRAGWGISKRQPTRSPCPDYAPPCFYFTTRAVIRAWPGFPDWGLCDKNRGFAGSKMTRC